MSDIDNPPAFPRDHRNDGHNGMTLRDYFAAKAMAALIIAGQGNVVDAYGWADAMLRARKEQS